MNGKGDKQRPTDMEAYRNNWDTTFKKIEVHQNCGCIESRDEEDFLIHITPCSSHKQNYASYEPED